MLPSKNKNKATQYLLEPSSIPLINVQARDAEMKGAEFNCSAACRLSAASSLINSSDSKIVMMYKLKTCVGLISSTQKSGSGINKELEQWTESVMALVSVKSYQLPSVVVAVLCLLSQKWSHLDKWVEPERIGIVTKSNVSINFEANLKKTFVNSQKRKCKLGVFPTTGLEQINWAAKRSLVRRWQYTLHMAVINGRSRDYRPETKHSCLPLLFTI